MRDQTVEEKDQRISVEKKRLIQIEAVETESAEMLSERGEQKSFYDKLPYNPLQSAKTPEKAPLYDHTGKGQTQRILSPDERVYHHYLEVQGKGRSVPIHCYQEGEEYHNEEWPLFQAV